MICLGKSNHGSGRFGRSSKRIVSILLVLALAVCQLAAWPFSSPNKGKTEEQQELIAQLEQSKEELQNKLSSLEQWLADFLKSAQTSDQDLEILQAELKNSTDLIETLKLQLVELQARNDELSNLQKLSTTAYSDLENKLKAVQSDLDVKVAEVDKYYKDLVDARATLAAQSKKKTISGFFGGGATIGQDFDFGKIGLELMGGVTLLERVSLYATLDHPISLSLSSYLEDWKMSLGFMWHF